MLLKFGQLWQNIDQPSESWARLEDRLESTAAT